MVPSSPIHIDPTRRDVVVGTGVAGVVAAATVLTPAAFAEDAPSGAGSSMPEAVASAFSWTPDFVSDFTSMQSMDTDHWSQGWFPASPSAPSGPVNAFESAAYSPANLALGSDGLHFKLTNTSAGGRPHTAAQVTTHGLVSLTPSSWIEARLNMPGAPDGTVADWPGFWLAGYDAVNGGKLWPQYGEIDIMEGLAGRAAWNYHWGANPGEDSFNPTGIGEAGKYVGWHTFAVHWEWDRLTFYYDGVQLGEPVTEHVQGDPHYIVLGHTSSNWGSVGSELICSAVRAWKHT